MSASQEVGKRIERELVGIIGEGVFNGFTPEIRNAVARATVAMGVTIVVGAPEEAAQNQALLEAKAVLSNVKVAGLAAGGNLWDALGSAFASILSPLLKLGAGMFGIKLG